MENGHRHFSRDKKNLIKTYRNISENSFRIWLFKSLMSENFATRGIYTFAKNQSELRSIIKVLDRRTKKKRSTSTNDDGIKLRLQDKKSRRKSGKNKKLGRTRKKKRI